MRASIKMNIPEIKGRMDRVAWAVRSDFAGRAKSALEMSQANLKRTTPRRTRKMADGWRVNLVGNSKKGRVPVFGFVWNHNAEKGRWRYQSRDFKVRFSNIETGRINTRNRRIKTDGHKILSILEFGSQPHTIVAGHATAKGKPGFLRFKGWGVGSSRAGSQVSEFVFARKVEHPGYKGRGMIRIERIALRHRMKKVLRETAKVPQRVMRGEIKG